MGSSNVEMGVEVQVAVVRGSFGLAAILLSEFFYARRIREYRRIRRYYDQLEREAVPTPTENLVKKGASQLVSVILLVLLSIVCLLVGEVASRTTGSVSNGVSVVASSIPVLFLYAVYVALRYKHIFAFLFGLVIIVLFYGALESLRHY